jgi:hypothetical protein
MIDDAADEKNDDNDDEDVDAGDNSGGIEDDDDGGVAGSPGLDARRRFSARAARGDLLVFVLSALCWL